MASMAMARAEADVNALKSSNVAFHGARKPITKFTAASRFTYGL